MFNLHNFLKKICLVVTSVAVCTILQHIIYLFDWLWLFALFSFICLIKTMVNGHAPSLSPFHLSSLPVSPPSLTWSWRRLYSLPAHTHQPHIHLATHTYEQPFFSSLLSLSFSFPSVSFIIISTTSMAAAVVTWFQSLSIHNRYINNSSFLPRLNHKNHEINHY